MFGAGVEWDRRPMGPHGLAELDEARTILSYCARGLRSAELAAVEGLAHDVSQSDTARSRGLDRGVIWAAERTGLRKLRVELARRGLRSVAQFLSAPGPESGGGP